MENLRASSYIIPVKLDAEKDKFMLIHGYTGAIDIVTNEYWEQLKNYSPHCGFLTDSVITLKQRGYLTNKTLIEEQAYVKRIANALHKSQMKLHKCWGFIITYNCNFRCPYCFENEISCNGSKWSKSTLSKDLVDKAFMAMLEIEPHKELHQKEILLYGGEPFLKENKDIVKYIVEKGNSENYRFKVITNGYDLDYYEDILDKNIFTSFQITLDGYRDKHNLRKKHYKEGNSFDKIITNVELLLKHEITTSIRINIDESNFSEIEVLRRYFQEKGFTESSYFRMYPSMITKVGYSNKKGSIKYINTYQQFIEKLNQFSPQWAHTRDFNIYHKIYSSLVNKTSYQLVSTICPAQYGTCLFDPCGNIFPCLEVVGKKEHCIGRYDNGTVMWTEKKNDWYNKNVCEFPTCQTCIFALLCGGRCLARYMRDSEKSLYLCKGFPEIFPVSVNQAYNNYISK